jgi:hypothetical protein
MGTEMLIGADKHIDTDTGMGMDMKRTNKQRNCITDVCGIPSSLLPNEKQQ